jgi:hypothetical protein
LLAKGPPISKQPRREVISIVKSSAEAQINTSHSPDPPSYRDRNHVYFVPLPLARMEEGEASDVLSFN